MTRIALARSFDTQLTMERQRNPEREQIRRWRLALAGLVMGTILLRTGLALVLPRVIKWDEPAYLLLGRNLLSGQGFTTGLYPELHFTPFYAVISGAFYLLVGDFEWAGNLAYALFGGLLLVPVFAIARRIYGTQTAWLACLLLAIFPALTAGVLYWGTMTEPLYLFLIYGGLAALLAGLEDKRPWLLAVAGMLFGLGYLCRPEGVIYFAVFLTFGLAWLLLQLGKVRGSALTGLWSHTITRAFRAQRPIGYFVLLFVIVAAPYVLYLRANTGLWLLTGKLAVEGIQRESEKLDSTGREILWLSPERFNRGRSFLQTILADPNRLAQRLKNNIRKTSQTLFDRHVFWYGLLPLVFLALFKEPWDKRRLWHELFLVAAIVPPLALLELHALVRLLAPVFPVFLLWTTKGAVALGTWLQETLEACRGGQPIFNRYLKAGLGTLPAGMVFLLFLATLPEVVHSGYANTVFGYKEAGLWLRTHSATDARLMSSDLAATLYADRFWVPVPNTDWPRFLKYARSHNASYLLVDTYQFPKDFPEVAFLCQTGAPELELVFSFDEIGRRTLVYRFLPAN